MKSRLDLATTERLAGVEWMRGVAAFGVICIHAGLAVHNKTTTRAGTFLPEIFDFAVPFFLITSFFFAIRSEISRSLSWRTWWNQRAGRLLIPYAFWSVLYLALHVAKLILHHQAAEIAGLLESPATLILSGGTSVALYFLPLVFIGLFLAHVFTPILKRLPSWALVFAFIGSILLRAAWNRGGPYLTLESTGFLGEILRLALGCTENGLRCLPLIVAAYLLCRILPRATRSTAHPLLLAGLAGLGISHLMAPLNYMQDSLLGVAAFVFAWGLSGLISPGTWATTLGLFSFGVYLVHQIYLELIQLVLPAHDRAGVIEILAITSGVFVVSILTTAAASRCGWGIRKIFGLK